MIKEQELKNKCTPEFTKWICEHAEGFGYIDYVLSQSSDLEQVRFNNIIFPLLIHRAIEGWNKKREWLENSIIINKSFVDVHNGKGYKIKSYSCVNLTQSECAMLHCLLDVFKQEERDE